MENPFDSSITTTSLWLPITARNRQVLPLVSVVVGQHFNDASGLALTTCSNWCMCLNAYLPASLQIPVTTSRRDFTDVVRMRDTIDTFPGGGDDDDDSDDDDDDSDDDDR